MATLKELEHFDPGNTLVSVEIRRIHEPHAQFRYSFEYACGSIIRVEVADSHTWDIEQLDRIAAELKDQGYENTTS